jgi:hypothetical protein
MQNISEYLVAHFNTLMETMFSINHYYKKDTKN